jgi:hypothetical protein
MCEITFEDDEGQLPLRHKVIFGITTLSTLKVKMIAPRTYQPLEGKEKGVTHYLFNKSILKKLC